MRLEIRDLVIPQRIEWNYEELKAELAERVKTYETIVYTEDQIKEAKADRANLNKLKKAIDDERKRQQKVYMEPFDLFKKQCDEIIALIEKPAAMIDRQVKEYEDAKKAEKEGELRAYIAGKDRPYNLSLAKIWNPKWLNATVKVETAKAEIDAAVERVLEDVKTLEGMGEWADKAIAAYGDTLDLRQAMNEVQRQKERAEREAEIRRQAEEARRRLAEEEAKKAPAQEEDPRDKKFQEILDRMAGKEPMPAPEPEPAKAPEEIPHQWVNFSVRLNRNTAQELKAFLVSHGIEYKRI